MRTILILSALLLSSCYNYGDMKKRSLGKVKDVRLPTPGFGDAAVTQVITETTSVTVYNTPRFCIGTELIGYFDDGHLTAVLDCENFIRRTQ